MNHRERTLAAIFLEEPDRVPLDSTFSEGFLKKLMGRFDVNDEIKLRINLGLDVIYCSVNDGFLTPTKMLPDGSYISEFGVRVKNMPVGGVRFIHHPIESYEDFMKINLPNPHMEHRYRNIIEIIDKYHEEYAIFCDAGWGLFEKSWALRGFANFLKDIYREPRFVENLLDKVLDFQIEIVKKICEYPIDMICFGDDFGMQDRLIISASIWRKLIKPRWSKLMAIPKSRRIPIMFHSDGNILEIIPDLIEIGVDVLDPVQPKALNPSKVKEMFGEELALHGLIDIQEVLPFYSSSKVRDAIKKLIMKTAMGGGIILSPTHTVLPEVPLENYLSFLKTVKKWGRYSY